MTGPEAGIAPGDERVCAPDAEAFAERVLAWFDAHGRKDLPWQIDPTPYRVWVSEIMLQQTRVESVIPYYLRFMQRFPDLRALAGAPLDEVLHLWSGLGYYARARNLHAAAQRIDNDHGGCFPEHMDAVATLPGVGRSTAGAILALACGQRHAILDGNVKRVLARYCAVEGWPGRPDVASRLWGVAERLTPQGRVPAYTQAMMDLGATVCTRARPACGSCPVACECEALRGGRVTEFPAPKPRRELPVRATRMLLLSDADGAVLLERRPPAGIWGGLWGFPELPQQADPVAWCRERLRCEVRVIGEWPQVRHTFTHFHLDIAPLRACAKTPPSAVLDADACVWYNTRSPDRRGLAAPVSRLLDRLHTELEGEVNDTHGTVHQAR